jgi:hypothetical protein
MLLVDDFSRYIFIFFLKHHNEALIFFKQYRVVVEKYLEEEVAVIRVDNVPEFIKGEFKAYCLQEGIQFEKTVPDASQQNGVVERANQTVENSMHAMLLDAGLPLYFWPLAAQAAVHINNRLPHSALPNNVTPFFRWFGVKPDISHFRPFGSLVTACKSESTDQNKVYMHGEEGQFLEYARDSAGYLIYFPESRTIHSRCDVDFHGLPIPSPAPPLTPLEIWKDIPLDLESRFQDRNAPGEHNSQVSLESQTIPSVPLNDIPSSSPGELQILFPYSPF